MSENQLQALFQDKEFVTAFIDAKTPEAAQSLLTERQMEMPLEQVKQLKLYLEKFKTGELNPRDYVDENGELKAELSPAELEQATGGTTPALSISAVSAAGVGALTYGIATFFLS